MLRTVPPVVLALGLACAGDPTGPRPDPQLPPPGPDVQQPFPIDRGDDADTPGTYKGLWLRLVDTGEPTVTPVDGVIGVVCLGMSNAQQECGTFVQRAQGEWSGAIAPAVRVVNCAVGGHAIERWIDPAFDATLWEDCTDRRLPQAGVRLEQVRVIHHKAANQFTRASDGSALPTYPAPGSDYEHVLANLTAFADRVRTWFPAVQAVYTTSRSYGGFANNAGRGEPLSYEEGHGLNTWLRELAPPDGVWYGWGAYLWAPACADGVVNGRGICYERDDFVSDGVHPSDAGRAKIAGLMHERFLEHAWYRLAP